MICQVGQNNKYEEFGVFYPQCDGCGIRQTYNDSIIDYISYTNMFALIKAIKDIGWRVDHPKLYCPKCIGTRKDGNGE